MANPDIGLIFSTMNELKWYKDHKRYHNTVDVLADKKLINFKKDKSALFSYIHLRESSIRRIPNSLARRIRRLLNWQTGTTMGLMNVQCPIAMLNLLNLIAKKTGEEAGLGKPFPFLVTSILRTTEHQHHLQTIGYPATSDSSHCCGYAADIEMGWLKANRPRIAGILREILNDYFERGVLNLVDYGKFVHICLNPLFISQFEKKVAE